jgi:hypothetical protein
MAAPRPGQAFAELEMVVDLAVVDGDEPAARRGHGLLAGGGKIEDGEPAVAERDLMLRLQPRSGAVGPAIGDRAGHPGQHGARALSAMIEAPAYEAGYAAHD